MGREGREQGFHCITKERNEESTRGSRGGSERLVWMEGRGEISSGKWIGVW